jgi:hypothetical protein
MLTCTSTSCPAVTATDVLPTVVVPKFEPAGMVQDRVWETVLTLSVKTVAEPDVVAMKQDIEEYVVSNPTTCCTVGSVVLAPALPM